MIDYGGTLRTRKWYDEYSQDFPLREQTKITGHAVRAMYLYTGAADVGAAKNDSGYMNAMKQVWEDVVYRNMYITGGIRVHLQKMKVLARAMTFPTKRPILKHVHR